MTIRQSPAAVLRVFIIFLAITFPAVILYGAEETAHMTFSKGKIPKKNAFVYEIKKGDRLYALIGSFYQADSPQKRKAIYTTIKKMNPQVVSIHKIYYGQKLRLPGTNLFPVRQAIALTTKTREVEKTPPRAPAEQTVPQSIYRLSVIRDVVERMHGTLATAGNYFIPIPQAGLLAVDCSKIPVVELTDGSIILLDFSQRISSSIRKMIHDSWPNYHFVNVNHRDDPAQILLKTINASKAFRMTKRDKPLLIGKAPQVELTLDWLIADKDTKEGKSYQQGLTFLKERRLVLPKPIATLSGQNELVLTEILDGVGIIDPPAMQATIAIPVLKGSTNLDLCADILNAFNIQPLRNVDVKIFDQNRDGFNLSIKADLLIKLRDRQLIYHEEELPPQFMEVLKESGIAPLMINRKDSRRTVIEKTMVGLGIPFSYGFFSFPFPRQLDTPRAAIRFPSVRVSHKKSFLYLVDFDMNPDLYGFLHDFWEVDLVRF